MNCTHPGPCRPGFRKHHTGRIRICLERESIRAREYRARKAARAAVVDGLEGEYGPVPPSVPDSKWFDEVAVDNAIFGGLSRRLTRPELEAYIARTRRWTLDEVAVGIGVTPRYVQERRLEFRG